MNPVSSNGTLMRRDNVSLAEKWLGHFLGPSIVFAAYSAVGGNYLIQFYTDILGVSGYLITILPLFSNILGAVFGLFMGLMH